MKAQEYWALEGPRGKTLYRESEETHNKEETKLEPKFKCKPQG